MEQKKSGLKHLHLVNLNDVCIVVIAVRLVWYDYCVPKDGVTSLCSFFKIEQRLLAMRYVSGYALRSSNSGAKQIDIIRRWFDG